MKFQCQESCGGQCCKIPGDSFVFLTKQDVARIVQFTGLSSNTFSRTARFDSTRFTTTSSHQTYLQKEGKACLFFREGKCSIYEARPTQCRTFPYWPGLSEEDAKASCPGVGLGDDRQATRMFGEQWEADKELRGNLCKP